MKIKKILFVILSLIAATNVFAKPKLGEDAPIFTSIDQDNKNFNLNDQKGKWTVLYFYPKADTPGCTKQACAFRDNINHIKKQGGEVYGISINTPKEQKEFSTKHNINFPLLSDDGRIASLYGTKMPLINISKRWTFIIGPDLKIKDIAKDVDPIQDAKRVAEIIASLKN